MRSCLEQRNKTRAGALTTLLLVISALGLTARPDAVRAQTLCYLFPDDGFNPGCCASPMPQLPPFLPIQTNATWAWIHECVPSQSSATVSISSPTFFQCDYAWATMHATVSFGTEGSVTLTGTLIMKYARTWGEPANPATPVPHQVWRFLVNADLDLTYTPGPVAILGNPIPRCSRPPYNRRVHSVGHVDYACDAFGNPGAESSFSLSHLPECISHASYSQRSIPALAGLDDSYHLVGPAPFTFMPVQEPQGTLVGEAVRGSNLDLMQGTYSCQGEAEIRPNVGQLATQSSGCLCSATGASLWKHQTIQGEVCCGGQPSNFSNLPVSILPFSTGLAALPLGRWGNTLSFPGSRTLTIYIGLFQYEHPCPTNPFPIPGLSQIQAVTGVATSEHDFVGIGISPAASCQTGPIWTSNALDLQNMLSFIPDPAFGAILFPTVGGPFAATLVWNLNLL